MTLAPLLNAEPVILMHAFAAMGALVLGAVQFARVKGTFSHRTIGAIWVTLMLIVSVSAFFIHKIRLWGEWSPIHLLAIFTLLTLPLAVWQAHRHNVSQHKKAMISIYTGGLIIAGLFTFVPGRIMHAVVFGP
jgi:uncharacterized membrane protein